MAGTEYRAREKKVQKMSRDGLMEENLSDGSQTSISHKAEAPPKIRSSEEKSDTGDEKEASPNRKRRLYREKETNGQNPEEHETQKLDREKECEPPERAVSSLSKMRQRKPVSDQKIKEKKESIRESSRRMEQFQETEEISDDEYKEKKEAVIHNRKKRLVQEYAGKKAASDKGKNFSDDGEEAKKFHEHPGQDGKKKGSRLSFDDEDTGFVKGAGTGIGKKAASVTAMAAKAQLRGKIKEDASDNAAIEGVLESELAAEQAAKVLKNAQERRKKHSSYAGRLKEKQMPEGRPETLHFGMSEGGKEAERMSGKAAQSEAKKKAQIKRFWQKRRITEAYEAAKDGKKSAHTVKAVQSMTVKARQVAKEIFQRNSGLLVGLGIFALLFALMSTSLASCGAGIQGFGTTFVGTTYASTDADIYAVENAYAALEAALNEQINSMENRHEGHDEYRYNIDEISHNPYHLISYFTVKYGEFTYDQVAEELQEIFEEQYSIRTQSHRETVTETRTVRVGESLGNVVTSGYCNCSICCGQWSGGPTASGVYPTANHTIAVDASNPFVPMGTKVVMNGVEYTVEDTGAFDQYGVQFDVYYGDHATASAHGHQTWEAFIADDNGNREVEVTQTHEINRMDVTLTNHDLDAVLRNRMTDAEEERYDLYNHTYGNRSYLFDIQSLPSGGGGFGYEIPPEALSDEKFANMIREAEKYLGYPYVWGGASPSTSFDCSGFVSWVINNCGNGWNVGRQTADGLRGCCAQVPSSQAKPGDLIFFQGTYNTPGASHVGIYVGNGMMIHCGDPIKYTSIETSYWQQHFMAFGRLP